MFGIPFVASSPAASLWKTLTLQLLALSPPDKWSALLDRHVGMALQKEATKRKHWQALSSSQDEQQQTAKTQFFVQDGRLHVGPTARYDVKLLGVEGMDAFLWAWALTDDMRQADPALNSLTPELIVESLKEHPELKMNAHHSDGDDDQFYPEFSIAEPIPLSMTHQGQTFADVAAGVLGDDCRAIYQVPDYASGLVYYWMVTDEDFPLDNDDTCSSACARLSAMVQTMVHPSASHRINNVQQAFTGYAQALGMKVISNEDGSQLTASPANVFWGDSFMVFVDPDADKIVGLSAQYNGALHTGFVNFDEFGKFEKWDFQPSLDLATGEPVDADDSNDEPASRATTPAVNGSTQ